ncbi:co-chaperone YbbN [Brevundimonas sp.]|uniref:co-chaperone YbbN n=1 Tax=Brevundimonas sp. TaxID=1871086 RepID=UPI00289DC984|nr:co-chaperone YbbN [Brevundimonas sp.]
MSLSDPSANPPSDLIVDGTDATFMRDVVEASKTQPVIVDFWATWCGPCRTLGPLLEKNVRAAGGAVKMVKIDVDANPAYAGQLRVQSIPTVYAFVNGQPVDGFQGAVPESQIKAFIDRLTGGKGDNPDVEQLLALGEESLTLADLGGAAQAFAQALTLDPKNEKAIAGMAKVYLADGDMEQAAQTIDMASVDSKEPSVQAVRAQLNLASKASGASAELQAKLAANPADHQARFELAQDLAASGNFAGAVNELLNIIEADREWNDQAARKELLTVFDAAGTMSDVSKDGRRRLSSLLFG